ncbi:hypothetical protein [Streptomyces sp. NPDC051577]|uniref:hypothetical protein n=1 Tax=Streptomyces sp. NPDC051577 TaxID=3155166 RepID=UPI00342F97C1
MINLVTREATVSRLRSAQAHAEGQDMGAALAGLADAFSELIRYYARRAYDTADVPGPLHLGPLIRPSGHNYAEFGFLRECDRGLEAIAAMQETLQVLKGVAEGRASAC